MSVSWTSLVPQDIVNKALKCVIASDKPFCPDYNNIFKAFTFFAPKDCIMVWVGQDLLFIIRKLIRVLYF